jgi:uncharacterized protein (DUF3084 family)
MQAIREEQRAIREERQAIREELELSRRDREETRQFMRDLQLRWQRVTERLIRQIDESSERMNRKLEEQTRAIERNTAEFVAESRAGREALFRMLDRLGPPPGGDETAQA